MAWFCSKCEKMMYWKIKGWNNPSIAPYNFYCDDCKKKIEENNSKRKGE
jgi:DNA-directed RNA polymerase subunit M/transcription elongation factor TFIIS